jgi:hypothetical protein
MLSLDSFTCQRSGKQTHLNCQEEALFSGHCPLDLQLDSLRRRACVGGEHKQMLSRSFSRDT